MIQRVRLFAILKERAGRDHVEVELPDSATVADAIAAVAALPGLGALRDGGVRMAVNREYATAEVRLAPDDELALIPPVSGGDPAGDPADPPPRVHVMVTPEPLDVNALMRRVQSPHAGALLTFHGLPRDISVLEYEAYTEMALERIAAILRDVVVEHRLCAAAAAHRTGPVPALEPSIVVAVSAPHRGEAFSGGRQALDRIKAEAPIWKVEVDGDGQRHRPEGVLPT